MSEDGSGFPTSTEAEKPEPKKGKASEQAATAAAVATRSVERAKFVAAKSPELAEKVREGKATLKQAEKQIRKAEQVKAIAKYVPPEGRYSVIVVDPPWPYDDELDGSDDARGGLPYPAMTLDGICALQVPADDDCVLWLWVTNAHLIDGSAAKVLSAWGFEGKTMITWKKNQMGAGRWLRGITEHAVLAVKGRPTINLTNQTTHFEAPRRQHSRKPDEFFALVEQLCPAPGKLEMFAREPRAGWVTSGAEGEKFTPAKITEADLAVGAAKVTRDEDLKRGEEWIESLKTEQGPLIPFAEFIRRSRKAKYESNWVDGLSAMRFACPEGDHEVTIAVARKQDVPASAIEQIEAHAATHRELKPSPASPKPGTCRKCGCTDSTPCPIAVEGTDMKGACAWVDETETLCTECAVREELGPDDEKPKRTYQWWRADFETVLHAFAAPCPDPSGMAEPVSRCGNAKRKAMKYISVVPSASVKRCSNCVKVVESEVR